MFFPEPDTDEDRLRRASGIDDRTPYPAPPIDPELATREVALALTVVGCLIGAIAMILAFALSQVGAA